MHVHCYIYKRYLLIYIYIYEELADMITVQMISYVHLQMFSIANSTPTTRYLVTLHVDEA